MSVSHASHLKCTEAVYEQVEAYLVVTRAITAECIRTNELNKASGYPHCHGLCIESIVEEFLAGKFTAEFKIGNKSFSMPGTGFPRIPSIPTNPRPTPFENREQSFMENDVTFELNLKIEVPLNTKKTVKCFSPILHPSLNKFAEAILYSEKVAEKYNDACL